MHTKTHKKRHNKNREIVRRRNKYLLLMMNEIPNYFSLLILINVNMQCHVRDDYSPSILTDLNTNHLTHCEVNWIRDTVGQTGK